MSKRQHSYACRDWPKEVEGIAEHVVTRVAARLSASAPAAGPASASASNAKAAFDAAKADLLRSQLRACISPENAVHALLSAPSPVLVHILYIPYTRNVLPLYMFILYKSNTVLVYSCTII